MNNHQVDFDNSDFRREPFLTRNFSPLCDFSRWSLSAVGDQAFKQNRADIAVSRVREHRYHSLLFELGPARKSQRDRYGRTAGDSTENALFSGEAQSRLNGLFVCNQLYGVHDREVQRFRYEACTDTLDVVQFWPDGLSVKDLRDHRACRGLYAHRNNLLALHLLDI